MGLLSGLYWEAMTTRICPRSSTWPEAPCTKEDSVLTCPEGGILCGSEMENPHASGSNQPRQYLFSLLRSRSTCGLDKREGHRHLPPNKEPKQLWISGPGDVSSEIINGTRTTLRVKSPRCRQWTRKSKSSRPQMPVYGDTGARRAVLE